MFVNQKVETATFDHKISAVYRLHVAGQGGRNCEIKRHIFNQLIASIHPGRRAIKPHRAAGRVDLPFPGREGLEICDEPTAFLLRCHSSGTNMVPPSSPPLSDRLLHRSDAMIGSNPPALVPNHDAAYETSKTVHFPAGDFERYRAGPSAFESCIDLRTVSFRRAPWATIWPGIFPALRGYSPEPPIPASFTAGGCLPPCASGLGRVRHREIRCGNRGNP
jgi:hypothetical protein